VIRAVLDANVFASGVLRYDPPSSPPGEILRHWLAGSFELITSDHVIAEIERTLLTNPYFAPRVTHAAGDRWVVALRALGTRVTLTAVVAGVASHPEEDLVLATAVSALADHLVTGDRQLQRLGHYRGVTIVSPRDFLTLLETREVPAEPENDRREEEPRQDGEESRIESGEPEPA
jgi:uncharacterized protein